MVVAAVAVATTPPRASTLTPLGRVLLCVGLLARPSVQVVAHDVPSIMHACGVPARVEAAVAATERAVSQYTDWTKPAPLATLGGAVTVALHEFGSLAANANTGVQECGHLHVGQEVSRRMEGLMRDAAL